MHLPLCGLQTLTAALLLLVLPIPPSRGDNLLEADGPGQSKTSTKRTVKQSSGKEVQAKMVEPPPVKTTQPWQITIGVPGWLAGVSGYTGFRGVNPYVESGVIDILKHTNVISSLLGEVRNGRYSVLGDYLYLNAQGGTGEGSGLVSKVDVGIQQFIGELFGSYRLIEGPHGWLDLLGGFRFIYVGEQVGLQANNMAIDTASTNLVDQFAQQLATPNSDLRNLVQQNIVDKLSSLNGAPHPSLPVGPVAGGTAGQDRGSNPTGDRESGGGAGGGHQGRSSS